MRRLQDPWTAIRLRLLLGRRQERLDQQADLFLRVRQRRHNMSVCATTDALFGLGQVAWRVPQSHDQIHFRQSSTKTRAQVTSMHHGGGRRGGNADHSGLALLDKIDHLAGPGRNRDGLHNASTRLQ